MYQRKSPLTLLFLVNMTIKFTGGFLKGQKSSASGTEFVMTPGNSILLDSFSEKIGSCATYTIHATSLRGATVNITAPLVQRGIRVIDMHVHFESPRTVEISENLCFLNIVPGIRNGAILIKASRPIGVSGLMHYYKKQQESFLAIPVESCGLYYTLICNYYNGFFIVTATADGDTTYTFHYKDNWPQFEKEKTRRFNPQAEPFQYKYEEYVAVGESFTLVLNQYQSHVGLFNGSIGSQIKTDKPVAVLCGSPASWVQFYGYSARKGNALVEQLLPHEVWGTEFFIDTMYQKGGYILIVSYKDNTTMSTLDGPPMFLMKKGDYAKITYEIEDVGFPRRIRSTKPIQVMAFVVAHGAYDWHTMHTILPTSLHASHYVFCTMETKKHEGEIQYYMAIVARDNFKAKDFCLDTTCSLDMRLEQGEGYWQSRVIIEQGRHILYHTRGYKFGLYIHYTSTGLQRYSYPAGYSVTVTPEKRILACQEQPLVLGDSVDNDCDGRIDEELVNNMDDDSDGKVDEDTLNGTDLYKTWTKWSEWACAKSCGAVYPRQRFRTCLANDERRCYGNDMEQKGVCDGSNVECPDLCPKGFWGDNCTNTCPRDCSKDCNKWNGTCESCNAGFQGMYCESECPRYKFGDDCLSDCRAECYSDCDRKTGQCQDSLDKSVYFYIALALGVVMSVIIAVCCTRLVTTTGHPEGWVDPVVKFLEDKTEEQALTISRLIADESDTEYSEWTDDDSSSEDSESDEFEDVRQSLGSQVDKKFHATGSRRAERPNYKSVRSVADLESDV